MIGIVMALGIVVDDAIVVGEHSLARFEAGDNPVNAASNGAQRMFPPVMASSLTTLAAFLPLLVINEAFIREIPAGVTEPATALPVQIYQWSDFPERLFEMKTAGAIVVLLVFLIAMNAFAIFMRRRFERRW